MAALSLTTHDGFGRVGQRPSAMCWSFAIPVVRASSKGEPMYDPSPAPSVPTDAHLRQQRPVICAVDDDGHAPVVLGTAAVLAAQLAVPLTVVHSPSPDVYLVGEPRRAALARGNAFVDELAGNYAVDERVVELNDPAHLVTDVAEQGSTMIFSPVRAWASANAAPASASGSRWVASDSRSTCPLVASRIARG